MNNRFDVVYSALEFYGREFDIKELNNGNFEDYADAFSAIKSFAEFVVNEELSLDELGVESINKFIKYHQPTSIDWYIYNAPLLGQLVEYLIKAYYSYLHPSCK